MTDGVQTGWRLIFDLSSPEHRSVNDGIPPRYGSIVYETLQDAIRPVARAGRGAVMMKRDLKSAFRHVPVSSSDHWLLIFEWQGKYYVDMFLPFGLRTAPRIFNLFSEALHWVFETLMDGISRITWTISCSSSLPEWTSLRNRTSSIEPLRQWAYPKLQKRTRTGMGLPTSASNSIPLTWRSVSLSTKSSVRFGRSNTSLTHRPSPWHHWKKSSASYPTAVKSSP
jgi:hypothetical protein